MEKIKHITLLTDFGNKDPYVAEMKGVLFSALPNIIITDLSHEISPQNIMEGALFLERVWDYWKLPSIHIVVIDPGVGTDRRIMVIHEKQKFLICPDNGVASLIIKNKHAEVRHVRYFESFSHSISYTFHGRDVMAPIAVQLAKGGNWEDLGPAVEDICFLNIPPIAVYEDCVKGEVIHIDRFGNAVTNIKKEDILDRVPVYARIKNSFQKVSFGLRYGDVDVGSCLCLWGSGNRLEIAVNCGSAKEKLKIRIGTELKLFFDKG